MKYGKTYWFGRKRFGFGFGPRTWQGWAAIAVYVALMISLPHMIAQHTHRMAGSLGLTAAFAVIFFLKLDTSDHS